MVVLTAKQELVLEKGWMNSAGVLGFNLPFSYWQNQPPIAYITPPLTEKGRPPAVNRKVMRFAGGVLLRNGGFNPGLRTALKENTERWARSKIPVWVHLLLEDPHSAERMLAQVETCLAVTAVEISLPQEWSAEQSAQILRSLRKIFRLSCACH
jgi:dihydroorotate dehydrogenase